MIVRKWDGEERRESPYFRILQVALLLLTKARQAKRVKFAGGMSF